MIPQHKLWEDAKDPIQLSIRHTLRRNLPGYLFPHKLSEPSSKELLQKLEETFGPATLENKELLCEHFLLRDPTASSHPNQGYHLKDSLLFLYNMQDHLTLHHISANTPWKEGWEALSQIESPHTFVKHPAFGHLTSNPKKSGTAYFFAITLHLPLLQKSLKLTPDTLNVNPDPSDDIVIVQNKYTLGLTEDHIHDAVNTCSNRLIAEEKKLRKEAQASPPDDLLDLILRSHGLITSSYKLTLSEALSALSKLKLGLDLGYVANTDHPTLNRLFTTIRRAHLATDNLDHARSEHLKSALENVTIQIP